MKKIIGACKAKLKNLPTNTQKYLVAIGSIAGGLTFIYTIVTWSYSAFNKINTVDIPDAYSGEVWKNASSKDFSWLQGNWYYPSLPDFYTHYKIENGHLYQQNEGSRPERFKTNWIEVKVFISNKKVLRLRYSNDWPGTFVYKEDGKKFDFYNFDRFVGDDGNVSTGHKRLVLNKDKCKITDDGMTYTCEQQ